MIILCNGMIRSGSTLQYNVVKEILENKNSNFDLIGFVDAEIIRSSSKEFRNYSEEKEKIYLIKSHDYSYLNNLDGVKVIYSHRNLMDVAGSLKRKFGKNGEDLIFGLDKCIADCKQILTSKTLLIQDYELLLGSLEASVFELCNFLDIKLKPSAITEIVNNNAVVNVVKTQNKNKSFKKQKQFFLEKALSFNINLKHGLVFILGGNRVNKLKHKLFSHDKETLLHLNHVSKDLGRNGKWIEILTEEEVKLIKNNFQKWMDLNLNEILVAKVN